MRDDDPAAVAEPARTSVGLLLRRAREAHRATLFDVSAEIRIDPRLLAALEEDRFDVIGAPVFIKGYIKNYAECVGLDSARMLELYRNQHREEDPVLHARKSLEDEPERPVGPVVLAAGAIALLAAVVWISRPIDSGPPAQTATADDNVPAAESSVRASTADAGVQSPGEPDAQLAGADARSASEPSSAARVPVLADARSPETAVAPTSSVTLSTGVVPTAVDGNGTGAVADGPAADASSSRGAAPATAAGSAAPALTGPGPRPPARSVDAQDQALSSTPQSLAASATPSTGGGPAAATAAGAASLEVSPVGTTQPQTAAAGTESAVAGLDVELEFVEDSWAEVVGPGDERLYYGLGRAGKAARFSSAPPIAVLLGNADGVTVTVDGEPFVYPSGSRRGNLANFTLTAAAE